MLDVPVVDESEAVFEAPVVGGVPEVELEVPDVGLPEVVLEVPVVGELEPLTSDPPCAVLSVVQAVRAGMLNTVRAIRVDHLCTEQSDTQDRLGI